MIGSVASFLEAVISFFSRFHKCFCFYQQWKIVTDAMEAVGGGALGELGMDERTSAGVALSELVVQVFIMQAK